MLEHLPEDILLKVFELLSTKDVARQACICRSWRDTVMNNWNSITLYPETRRLAGQCAWLAKVADIRPQMLQTLQMQRMEKGAASQLDLGVLPGLTSLQDFSNLRRLVLAGSERQNHKFTQSRVALTASTVQNLSSLIYLEELVIKYKPLENSTTWRLPKNDISFSEFSAFTRMQHLEVTLIGHNLHLTMSPQMKGLKRLKFLGIERLMSLEINDTMAAIANNLQVFKLGIGKLPDQVLVMPQLTGLVFRLCGTEAQDDDMHRLPFHLLQLRELSFDEQFSGFYEGALARAVVELTQQLSTLPDLTKLILDQNSQIFQCLLTSAAVRHFSCLENLKKLHIGSFMANCTEPSLLTPFTCLRSLEALTIMDLLSSSASPRVLLGENEILQKLRSLHIVARISRDWSCFNIIGVDLDLLPVLRELKVHLHSFAQALHSSSLEVLRLDLKSAQSLTEAAPALLGNLQRLHTLHACVSSRNLEEIRALAKEITALANLKQVIVMNARDSKISFETINPMLAAFSHVQHIDSLELRDEWKSVILDTAILPLVQHLRLRCYKLELTPYFASQLERSFQYQLLSVNERPWPYRKKIGISVSGSCHLMMKKISTAQPMS